VGYVGHLEAIIQETMPGPFNWLAPHVMRWAAFRSEPAASKPGNVFEPMPEWNQVSGGWAKREEDSAPLCCPGEWCSFATVARLLDNPAPRTDTDMTPLHGLMAHSIGTARENHAAPTTNPTETKRKLPHS
jgi:hypothetical protein